MLNNKGFAVSTVLYTLLVSFLMFLAAALAMFSSSSSIVGKATIDLVEGNSFSAMQYKPDGFDKFVDSDGTLKKYPIKCIRFGDKASDSANLIKDKDGKEHYIFTVANEEYSRFYWFDRNTIVKIKTRRGSYKYWPRDFEGAGVTCSSATSCTITAGSKSEEISVMYDDLTSEDKNNAIYGKLIFKVDIEKEVEVILKDICY